MKYDVYLTARAKRQYKRLDAHIRNKIRSNSSALCDKIAMAYRGDAKGSEGR